MSSYSDDSDSSEDESYVPLEDAERTSDEETQCNGNAVSKESDLSKTDIDKIWNEFKSTSKSEKPNAVKLSSNIIPEPKPSTEKSVDAKNTITVTEVYDFAGEEVKISKEVSKESKEAQSHLKKANILPKRELLSGKGKRTGGLMGVLGKMNKKPKLSTLQKSKLDWQNYKDEEGIHEELTSHNKGKGGYLEKQFFLERTDYRQFEKERDMRLARSSKR